MLPHSNEHQPLQRYLMEALGLGIFMISIALFGSILLSPLSQFTKVVTNEPVRIFILSIFMSLTALFITVSPFTKPSGAHINPAVTICFLRLGRISKKDAIFYILFQLAGGTICVLLMAVVMQSVFINPPINYAVTQPGIYGTASAFVTELVISAIFMLLILFGNDAERIRKYLPYYIASLIMLYVNLTIHVSGFSMNPARSFASALPSGIWSYFWLYCLAPVMGMLFSTECYRYYKSNKYGSVTK